MKIAISCPPLQGPGVPLLGQNRQFQWFRSPLTSYVIYPVVPASAATLLSKNGHDVLWLDCAAEKLNYSQFIEELKENTPDVMAIESKTPVIKQHWKIVNDLKIRFPKMKLVLMGDHVSALPEESLTLSSVDYVLVGGDFDFRLLELVDYLSGKNKKLGIGVYYRDGNNKVQHTAGKQRGYDLNSLPIIDRELTKWQLYSKGNGSFKYTPNPYTMIGRDCWWRRPAEGGKAGCTFCSWTSIFPTWSKRSPEKLLDEIGQLINLGVKEVFDDTGTFPVGQRWLEQFCKGMIKRGYYKKIVMGCNMRAGALTKQQYQLLGRANFRFVLYGLESVNQKTLDRINKGTTHQQLEQSLKWAKEAGLEPHITTMFGYPWETLRDAMRTVKFIYRLFKKGLIDTMQATILIPYPGTALYDQAVANDWLITHDYARFDMSESILKIPLSDKELKRIVRDSYSAFWSLGYIKRRIVEIRSLDDLKFLTFLGTKYVSKLLDFLPSNTLRQGL